MSLDQALSSLDGKAELTAEDAVALRPILYGQGLSLDQAAADALFQLNADAGRLAPEWCALFIEAVTDFVVRQQDPPGYVDEAKAGWLIDSISRWGRIRGDEVELLIHVLEEADQVPERLSAFVLSGVKTLTLHRLAKSGAVAPLDIERLRRVVFAKGGEGNIAVTRPEAEVLFDINDAMAGAPANPAWTDFFVRAVANAVLFEPVWAPERAEEQRREAWVEDASIHPLRRIHADFANPSRALAEMVEALHETTHWNFSAHDLDLLRDRFAADEAVRAAAERVTAEEAHWLADRIGRDGRLDANEKALVAFLRANARQIDPALSDLLARAA